MKFSVNKAAQTNEYASDTSEIIRIDFEISPGMINMIENAQKFVKDHTLVVSVNIDAPMLTFYNGGEEYEEREEVEWRYEGAVIEVFPERLVVHAQNKWDSTDQIESDSFSFDDAIID